MKRILTPLLAAGLLLGPATAAAAQNEDCSQPTVNVLISAEAAVSRPSINGPSAIPLSNVYSAISQATKPAFVYAEAGPQFAGVLETLTPVTPPRSVAAYPSNDIPDDDTEDWGGQSRTSVTAISAFATSSGSQPLGTGDASAKNSRSWVSSHVECDTITVVAGWEANGVTIVPGSTIEQLSQQLTLVIGPDGASADVDSTVVGAEGFAEVPNEGRLTDPISDPSFDNGGPRMDVGDPRTSATTEGASAEGGGFHFLLANPDSGEGASYTIGSLIAQVDVLGPLDPNPTTSGGTATVTPTTQAPAAPTIENPRPVTTTPVQQPVAAQVVGTPPAPSTEVLAAVNAVRDARLIADRSELTVESTTWLPVIIFLASILLATQVTAIIRIGARWDPTLAWMVRHGDKARERFSTQYLKW